MSKCDCPCRCQKYKNHPTPLCATICEEPFYIHKTKKLKSCPCEIHQFTTLQRACCDCLIPKPNDFFDPYAAPCSPELYSHKFSSLRRKWSYENACNQGFRWKVSKCCDLCYAPGIVEPCYENSGRVYENCNIRPNTNPNCDRKPCDTEKECQCNFFNMDNETCKYWTCTVTESTMCDEKTCQVNT